MRGVAVAIWAAVDEKNGHDRIPFRKRGIHRLRSLTAGTILDVANEAVDCIGGVVAEEHAGLGVKTRDGCHLIVRELEIEDVQVFLHAFLVRGLGQGDDVTLGEPAQNHLRDGLAVRLADLAQSGIGEHVLNALPERRPCFLRHSAL